MHIRQDLGRTHHFVLLNFIEFNQHAFHASGYAINNEFSVREGNNGTKSGWKLLFSRHFIKPNILNHFNSTRDSYSLLYRRRLLIQQFFSADNH